jgi:hypothetical protein
MNPLAGETKAIPEKEIQNSSLRTDGRGFTSLNIRIVL